MNTKTQTFTLLDRLFQWSITDQAWNGDLDKLRRAKLGIVFAFATSIWGPFFSAFYYIVFHNWAGTISVFTAGILMWLTPVIMRFSQSVPLVGHYVTAVLYWILLTTSVISGGQGEPPLNWMVSVPMIAICFGNRRAWYYWFVIVGFTLVCFYVIKVAGVPLQKHEPEEALKLFEVTALAALTILITSFAFLYELQKEAMLVDLKKSTDFAENALTQLKHTQGQLVHTEKMSALGGMATGIAHEINNPLAIISLNAQAVQMHLEKGAIDNELISKKLSLILKSVDRASKITQGLLAFSRESSRESYAPTPVSQICDDTMVFCKGLTEQHSVEVRRALSADVAIPCRKGQISQVLLNLLLNSIQAIQGLKERWIEIACFVDANRLIITVTDSGKGIPVENRSKIFDPFFTTQPAGKGTGLGLSVSHRIIQSHSGRIYLDESHPHTRFVIELPLSGAMSPQT